MLKVIKSTICNCCMSADKQGGDCVISMGGQRWSSIGGRSRHSSVNVRCHTGKKEDMWRPIALCRGVELGWDGVCGPRVISREVVKSIGEQV